MLSSDVAVHKRESELTFKSTFKSMPIDTMIRFHGAKRSDVMAVVDLQLTRFLNSINISNPLSDFQKSELVMTLVERYKHETLNDFLLMFKMVRHGYFGPIYNRLDITVISEYMNKYLEMKAFEREHGEQQHTKEMAITEPIKAPSDFKSPEEYDAWRKKWYGDKLKLHDGLQKINDDYERKKRRGIIGIVGDDPRREMEYQKFKTAAMEKARAEAEKQSNETKTTNDASTRGHMDGNVDPGTDANVSVSHGGRSENVEPIQRAGSKHHQQGDGIQS